MNTNMKITRPRKTQLRMQLFESIIDCLINPITLDVINIETWDEERIQTFLHEPLRNGVRKIISGIYPKQLDRTIDRKVDRAILWSGDNNKNIPNLQVYGVNHRPDYVIDLEGSRYTVEIKRAGDGADFREGIGQSLLYTAEYDFVLYLVFDATESKSIKSSMTIPFESYLTSQLWETFNVKIVVV